MHGSCSGLIRHLEVTDSNIYALYRRFDTMQKHGAIPTSEELKVANGQIPFETLGYTLDQDGNICSGGERSFSASTSTVNVRISGFFSLFYPLNNHNPTNFFSSRQEPFDNEKWTRYLCEWIAACDQPFDTVEQPEFKRMVDYINHPNPPLHIPSATTVKNRVMDMGDETVNEIKSLINVSLVAVLLLM